MTNEDEVAIQQLPGAFDRLTKALHEGAKRRRRAGLAVAVVLAAIAFGVFDARNGVQQNQSHVDCVFDVLLEGSAPKCRGLADQLKKDGVLPPGGVPQLRKERTERDLQERLATTTTTTVGESSG